MVCLDTDRAQSVIPNIVQNIPHAFGKFNKGFTDSPFYNGVRLLFGDPVASQMW